MSLSRCIPGLVERGAITPEQAARAAGEFEALSAELRRSMAPDAAEALASTRVVEAVEFEARRKRANALRQIDAQRRTEQWLRGGGEGWGRGAKGGGPGGPDGPLPGEGPLGPINPKAARTLILMMDARRRAIEGGALRFMDGIMERHRRTLTGALRNPAEMDDLGRLAFGEKVTSPGALSAREFADAWGQATDWSRLRANAAGANIGKLENRGFGTIQDSRATAEAGFEQWFADHNAPGIVDRVKTVDETSGQPFTDADFREVMEGVFETIASDGASKRAPGAIGRLSFANRLGQHRFIHYASYDAWKAMQAKYGAGTPYDAMMGEIHGMARATAAMEIFGPNPEAGIRYMQDLISGDAELFKPGRLRQRERAAAEAEWVGQMWKEYNGELRRPGSRRLAAIGSSYRSVAASARLGTSPLTAISDLGYGMATRRFNGLPISGMVGSYVKLFNPLDATEKRLAGRLGFAADTWTSAVSTQTRFFAEEFTVEWSRRLADGVLRVSGLNGITDAGRQAFGRDALLGYVTEMRGLAWPELEPAFRSSLTRYRLGANEWDAIRATPLEEDGGMGWITPWNVERRELGDRLLEFAHNEMDFAVPVPDLETRTFLDTHARPGTVWGELVRSSPLLFKTFLLAVLFRHGARMAQQPGVAGKLGYFLGVAVPVTVFGVLAEQLISLAKGQDPAPMDPTSAQGRALWGRGFVRGGGASILGDLVQRTTGERYMGWPEYFAGPLVADTGELAAAGYGGVTGDDRAAWRAARVARQYVPGQNIWYGRKMVDVLLADRIQSQIDPDYLDSWRRMARRAHERGQDDWWERGALAPERAPDIGAIFGEVPE
jgi:hypothetical protein